MKTTIIATIQSGKPKLSPEQRKRLNSAFQSREGKLAQIIVGDIANARSNQQNKYYWGCVLKHIADFTGYSENEVHEYLKDRLLPKKYVKIAGVEVEARKSTSDLNTSEFEAYTERVRAFASEELQIVIELPNEA